jgi:hypothetical protein
MFQKELGYLKKETKKRRKKRKRTNVPLRKKEI